MSNSISGVVLITGAARRIGKALALDFAKRGWRVAVHYRHSRAEAADVVRCIEEAGGEAEAFHADLARIDDTLGLVPRCAARFGAPDCLINNASLYMDDRLTDLDEAVWRAHMDVNLRAPVFLAQAFAAALPADRQGAIINIIDQRVLRPRPLFFSYTASKSALWAVTVTMAQALAPRIRVNAIGPGPTLPSVYQSDGDFAEERRQTLLEHGASPQDVAAAAQFILEAKAMTGQMIALDAGQHLVWR